MHPDRRQQFEKETNRYPGQLLHSFTSIQLLFSNVNTLNFPSFHMHTVSTAKIFSDITFVTAKLSI